MMVKACLQNDDVEDGSFYSIIDTTIYHELNVDDTIGGVDDDVSHLDADLNGVNEVLDCIMWENSTKFEMVCKHWEALHDIDGWMVMKEAMKHHLYRHKFGEEVITTAGNIVEGYNPLII